MLYAINENGEKVRAIPGVKGVCPICFCLVVAKCGEIKIWHYAHRNRDCDSWYEPETRWHLDWKEIFGKEHTEVVIENHRADIITNDNIVIELQHSAITGKVIQEREEFYQKYFGKMIWVVDASRFRQHIEFFRPINHVNAQVNFDWKWWRKPWLYARMPIFFDFGECEINYPDCITGNRKDTRVTYENSLFWVKRMEEFQGGGVNCKPWTGFQGGGTWVSRKRFIERYRDGIGKPVNQQFPLVRRLTLSTRNSAIFSFVDGG